MWQAIFMSEQTIAFIEAKLDELIQRYQRLAVEHQALLDKEALWLGERARLVEKNEIARARIESMISRLKQIEMDAE